MVNSSDQMIRYWIDNILQLTRDGLKKPILQAYKARFPTSYMTEIQEKLRNTNGHYPDDMFRSDDLLLARLEDPKAWLNLMSKRWNDLFLPKSGSTGKRHVETLKEIRDKWAHSQPLTVQDAYSAAVTAINLLKDFQCDSAVQEIRAIFTELDKTQYVDAASPRVSPPPAAPGEPESAPGVSLPVIPELPTINPLSDGQFEGETDLVQLPSGSDDFYIEVVGREGKVYDQKIPQPVGRLVIGRSTSAHLNVTDPKVSRAHLLLTHTPMGLEITDLRSANGTNFEGKPLLPNQPVRWLPGQVVTIGSTLLILRRGV